MSERRRHQPDQACANEGRKEPDGGQVLVVNNGTGGTVEILRKTGSDTNNTCSLRRPRIS